MIIMIEIGDLFINAIEHWRLEKGIGTALIPFPLNDKLIILGVLQRIYYKKLKINTVIITNSFNERQNITEFLTEQENSEENNKEFKDLIKCGKIKIFTDKYIITNKGYNYPTLCIWYNPINICQELLKYVENCKFKLVVLNKIPTNNYKLSNLYKIAPLLSDFKQNELEQIRLSTPVEECQIGINIPIDSEEGKLLKYYNEYIATSISIFGSLDIIQQANIGNKQLNISANQICYNIALENGWNEHLNMDIEFNLEIDRLYNPINLRTRSITTYEIIRKRSQLLSDYDGKLEEIYNIIEKNVNKKILIINKRAEFASKVSDYINSLSYNLTCMNYHDKVENIPGIDEDFNPIYYKTGPKKGERKIIGAKSQKNLAVSLFNKNKITILSTNNAPDKDLNIEVDIVIITSPMCEDIKSYIYRLSNLYFKENKIFLYSLYCKDTLEQKLIENKTHETNHNVKNLVNDNNFSNFIIAD